MPGPGKHKSKSKKPSRPIEVRDLSNVDIPTVIDAFVDQINDARGWNTVVRLLCDMFGLPGKGVGKLSATDRRVSP